MPIPVDVNLYPYAVRVLHQKGVPVGCSIMGIVHLWPPKALSNAIWLDRASLKSRELRNARLFAGELRIGLEQKIIDGSGACAREDEA